MNAFSLLWESRWACSARSHGCASWPRPSRGTAHGGLWRFLPPPGMYLSHIAALLMGFGSPHGGIAFMPLWLLMATPINIGLYCGALLLAGALWRLLRRRNESR